jgi:hypothetical protein
LAKRVLNVNSLKKNEVEIKVQGAVVKTLEEIVENVRGNYSDFAIF